MDMQPSQALSVLLASHRSMAHRPFVGLSIWQCLSCCVANPVIRRQVHSIIQCARFFSLFT